MIKGACLSEGCANGPSTSPFAISLYAASVKWNPSQFMDLEGSEQTVVLGLPHPNLGSKLWGPPAPQHASNVLLLSNPA
jgi:hypothetical protein